MDLKKYLALIFVGLGLLACRNEPRSSAPKTKVKSVQIHYARGFRIDVLNEALTVIAVREPWPNAQKTFRYALVDRKYDPKMVLQGEVFDAVVPVPVTSYIATSTTHIPALDALGALDRLIGFPDTDYISTEKARQMIADGQIKDIGQNETLNTEMVLALSPDVVFGFGINASNSTYETMANSMIPVVYNGDWTEESPLGKAEWIKFFAPFFKKDTLAATLFQKIENDYRSAKALAQNATIRPTVISGALYKDVWYLPGAKSWAARFFEDANAHYLFIDNEESGSLALSWENVLEKGQLADFWVAPAQFSSFTEMHNASAHYGQFSAFRNKQVFTYAQTQGATGGMLYFELAPNRPDLVLKDLIHIFHPGLLPDHNPVFFKPLMP